MIDGKPIDWSLWPDELRHGDFNLFLFKQSKAADRFLSSGCHDCAYEGDMNLHIQVDFQQTSLRVSDPSVLGTAGFTIVVEGKNIIPRFNNDKLSSSVVDLLKSTVVITAGVLEYITIVDMMITPERGREVEILKWAPAATDDNVFSKTGRTFIHYPVTAK